MAQKFIIYLVISGFVKICVAHFIRFVIRMLTIFVGNFRSIVLICVYTIIGILQVD